MGQQVKMSDSSTGNFSGDHLPGVIGEALIPLPDKWLLQSINLYPVSLITYFTAVYGGNLDASGGRTTLRDGASRLILMRQGRI